MTSDYIDIVFDDGPSPTGGRFVEVENSAGASISFGEWVKRPDGYWALRIPHTPKVCDHCRTIGGCDGCCTTGAA
jgi:hypothetical protein